MCKWRKCLRYEIWVNFQRWVKIRRGAHVVSSNCKMFSSEFFSRIFDFSLPHWKQFNFSFKSQFDHFPLQHVCKQSNVPRMAYSSSTGSPSPVTFLTDDEKMMKETGSFKIFPYFLLYNTKSEFLLPHFSTKIDLFTILRLIFH